MSHLTFIEKEEIKRLFGISDGYVFKYWYDQGKYNKTKTKELIYDACGINIYQDEEYRNLSQEKCINKILNEGSPQHIAKLLKNLSEYFLFEMQSYDWEKEDVHYFNKVQKIIDRLEGISYIELPEVQTTQMLTIILEDIKHNLREHKPELIIDRLHTFTCEYIRNLCLQHKITIVDDKDNNLPIHSLVGMLNKWYKDNNYYKSQLTSTAIRNSISLFEKFNQVRNNHSAAHPNSLLSKAEAEYIVKIISDTLIFLDKIEQNQEFSTLCVTSSLIEEDDDMLPF